jgi:hypothetical protein
MIRVIMDLFPDEALPSGFKPVKEIAAPGASMRFASTRLSC